MPGHLLPRLTISALSLCAAVGTAADGRAKSSDPQQSAPEPYPVLVIIGDQWHDPGSYVIDGRLRFSDPWRTSGKDFVDVATMLRIWGIPFDVLRVDQQRLRIDPDAEPTDHTRDVDGILGETPKDPVP